MRLPPSVHNRLSYAGAAVALLGLVAFVFLFILHALAPAGRAPYAGLLIFVLVPAVIVAGLALVPIGMLFERQRMRRTGHASIERFPVLNLNDPHQRNLVVLFAVGAVALLFLSAFSSYHAYELTESVAFCGTTCHTVMEPEHTAYLNSPHARVRCVDCHVGPGAGWYVKSKLSGMYQVYAVALNIYPRPIPAPITSLRPAQETCEQCHWPEKFFEAQHRRQMHFLSDDENSAWEIDLLIKTGGGSPRGGQAGGIHWHMNIDNLVEYIATDDKRQEIPWVRMTNRKTGKVTEYMSTETPLTDEQKAAATIRTMDCMDCHNRPTHIYRAPRVSVNVAMTNGRIDPTLPAIKRVAVEQLTGDYDSTEAAATAIHDGIMTFYREEHPEVAASRGAAIAAAIAEVQQIYGRNFFPKMKVRWDTYPDNIGHFMFPGCFRCHDGLHQSADGQSISKNCEQCHTILAQGPPDKLAHAQDRGGLTFEHPIDIGTAWEEMLCHQCHTGAVP